MPTPTFISAASTALNNVNTPKTLSVTVAAGDDLLVLGTTADAASTLGTPTGGSGFTWTLLDSSTVSSNCTVYLWQATATSAQTFTLSVARSGANTNYWGFGVIRFSGVTGYGTPAKTAGGSGAPSQALTTVEANSTIAMVTADWNAVTGTRTYRTINSYTPTVGGAGEVGGFNGDGANYGVSIGYWPDAGAAGSKTVGTSAPTGQKFTILAVEVKGTASGSNTGTLSASLPLTTSSIAGTQVNTATLSGQLPRATSSVAGTQTNTATLAGSLPDLTASIAGTQTNPATMAASVPVVTGSIAGTSTNSGTLAGTLPTVTGSASGTQVNAGTLSASLPLLTSSISELVSNQGTLNASLPRVTAGITGTQMNPGTVSASLPRLVASIAEAGSANVGVLNASLPRITSAMSAVSVNSGALTASTPRATATLAGTMTNGATLAGTLPVLSGALTASMVNTGLLAGTLLLLQFFADDGVLVDITVTLGPPYGNHLTIDMPSRDPLTVGAPARNPLTLGPARS